MPPTSNKGALTERPSRHVRRVAAGSALTTSAPVSGSYCQTSTTRSTPRNNAPTDAAPTKASARSAAIGFKRRTLVRGTLGLLRHAMGEDSDERERGDGGLQQEDGSPVEQLGEQAPECRADHGSGDTGAGPQPATCGSRSVQRGEHRQRGPEHERRSGALQAPGEHEPGRLVRDACAERRECECREARDDEQAADSTDERREPAEGRRCPRRARRR